MDDPNLAQLPKRITTTAQAILLNIERPEDDRHGRKPTDKDVEAAVNKAIAFHTPPAAPEGCIGRIWRLFHGRG